MIKFTDQEQEIILDRVIDVWESCDNRQMAMAGYALATTISTMFEMKRIEHEEQRERLRLLSDSLKGIVIDEDE